MSKGAYIAIEGIPGAGKSTLIQMLAQELQAVDKPVLTLAAADKPNDLTTQTISRIIEDPRYPLTTQAEVLLYNAARAQSIDKIRASVEAGVTCIVDQSYLSVLVREYYGHSTVTDYAAADEIIRFATGALQPDLMIVLDTPVNTAKGRLSPSNKTPEFSEAQLERVRAGFLWEAKQRSIPVIYANDPVETVFEHVKSYAQNVITALKPKQEAGDLKREVASVAEVLAAHPVSNKSEAQEASVPTSSKAEATPEADTQQSPSTISRSSEQAPSLTLGQGSILLASQLNRLSPLSYTISTRRFSQRGRGTRRPYYIPESLQGKLRNNYIRTLDQIFDMHARLNAELTTYIRSASNTPKEQQTNRWQATTKAQARDVLEALLPIATTSAIELHAPSHTVQDVIIGLENSGLPEAHKASQQFLSETLRTLPTIAKQSLVNSVSAAVTHHTNTNTVVTQFANQLLPGSHADSIQGVTLTGYTPRNELDVVTNILYAHSDLPFQELDQTISAWSYEQKLAVFKAYVGEQSSLSTPEHALEAITYSFDIVSDYRAFYNLSKQGGAERLSWQPVTPRIGYGTPDLIERAGLSDAFAQCFDLSLLLYSELQAAGYYLEAQYATLLGHKMRWNVTYSARTLFRLHTPEAQQTNTFGYRHLLDMLHAAILEAHPLLGEMIHPTSQATVASSSSAVTASSR
jgi:dTMP kinase